MLLAEPTRAMSPTPPPPDPSTYVVSGWPSPNLTHIVYHYVGEERWEGTGPSLRVRPWSRIASYNYIYMSCMHCMHVTPKGPYYPYPTWANKMLLATGICWWVSIVDIYAPTLINFFFIKHAKAYFIINLYSVYSNHPVRA
nr:hypothetical protein [Morchella crassipes]